VPTLLTESAVVPARHPRGTANVSDFLLAGKDPARTALLTLKRTYSYGQLQSACAAVAGFLLEHGGCKGDRVLLLGDNSFFWIAAYLGAMRAGLVVVPLPPGSEPENLQHVVDLTEPRFAFLQGKASHAASLMPNTVVVTDIPDASASDAVTFRGLLDHSHATFAEHRDLPERHEDDLAALMFTSGSTGKPRGVMISHGNIIANTRSIIPCLRLTANDRVMAVLPFYYCFGASLLHTHLCAGGSVVTDSRFMYPDKVLQRMAETDCTGFAGVPSHFQILLRKSSLPRMKFPHLRYVQQAGGHLAPVFVRALAATLPSAQVFLMYGQTEATARLTCLSPSAVSVKPSSIGKAIPGVKLRVLNDAGHDVKPGEPGEIVAEGNNIALGYWRDKTASAATFSQRALRTGDIATVDEEGFLYLLDRTRDFVKCGGERISCQNLEEQLLEFDGLLEAAVIGVPDEVLGEAVKAFVVPRDPSSPNFEDRLRQFCKQNIPLKLIPRVIVTLKALPKNTSGKVLKPALRQM